MTLKNVEKFLNFEERGRQLALMSQEPNLKKVPS